MYDKKYNLDSLEKIIKTVNHLGDGFHHIEKERVMDFTALNKAQVMDFTKWEKVLMGKDQIVAT